MMAGGKWYLTASDVRGWDDDVDRQWVCVYPNTWIALMGLSLLKQLELCMVVERYVRCGARTGYCY